MPLFELAEGAHRTFYRIERLGCRVELHGGRIGDVGETKVLDHATEAEALRTYEAEVEQLRERGYVRVHDESASYNTGAATLSAKRPAPAKFLVHDEFEAALARDPEDEATWLVYEDWLLVQGDPRAAIIEAERARAYRDAVEARGKLATRLFGKREVSLQRMLTDAYWRAGFVCAATLNVTRPELVAEFVALPVARFLTELRMFGDFDVLAQAAAARHLRRLRVTPRYGGAYPFDARLLAPFEQLAELDVEYVSRVTDHVALAHVRDLGVKFTANVALHEIAVWSLAGVERLRLYLDGCALVHDGSSVAARLPALRALELHVEPGDVEAAISIVTQSDLGLVLERLVVATHDKPTRTIPPAELREVFGGELEAIAHVELPC